MIKPFPKSPLRERWSASMEKSIEVGCIRRLGMVLKLSDIACSPLQKLCWWGICRCLQTRGHRLSGFFVCSTRNFDRQLKKLSQFSWECSLSSYEDFRDRIVRRHLIGVHSIRSNPASKDQNHSKTRIKPQFPTKERSIWRRSYLWTFFGLLKNPHETRINTRENDYCKKIKSWHESWTRYEVSWKGRAK